MAEPIAVAKLALGGLQFLKSAEDSKEKVSPLQTSAAQRRLGVQPTVAAPTPQPAQLMEAPQNVAALEAARFEASQLPPAERQEYEPTLIAALLQARREEGLA